MKTKNNQLQVRYYDLSINFPVSLEGEGQVRKDSVGRGEVNLYSLRRIPIHPPFLQGGAGGGIIYVFSFPNSSLGMFKNLAA
ncbi:MAG: hypothetical protein IAE90_00090 [Ignavibacteria bacterium]|nr:hypothetical protein [Ignavibacteria bacterium]